MRGYEPATIMGLCCHRHEAKTPCGTPDGVETHFFIQSFNDLYLNTRS